MFIITFLPSGEFLREIQTAPALFDTDYESHR